MTSLPEKLKDPLQQLLVLHHQHPARLLVGLAGIPGSGKTTLATHWQQAFTAAHPTISMRVLSMDGFHLSKAQLAAMPDPERAFARRGAPWTFDAGGFVAKVQALKTHQYPVSWPDFKHDVGDPQADAVQIGLDCQIVLVEGLYLLHRADDWAGLEGLFDESWYLDTPLELARERLLTRHQQAWGISRRQAAERVDRSDSKNAELVWGTRLRADYWV